MSSVNIGIIGLGTVGGGTYEILKERADVISKLVGGQVRIKRVCDRREKIKDELGIDEGIFTQNYEDIINDPEISLVVVLTGNKDIAYDIIIESFKKSKHVVTANKALLALRWKEIFNAARENNSHIYFEASAASGVPLIQGINEGLAANKIKSIKGILNGTTNYILTKMSRDFSTLREATESAVKAGFAEPDSTADIEGYDAAYKICVLANIIFARPVDFKDVYVEGINNIDIADIKYAREMFNLELKLLAVVKKNKEKVEIRVHPALLAKDDMLSGVNYENNGVLVDGNYSGPVMFYGKGAGRFPAASAVVSDIIYLAQKINYNIAGRIPYVNTDTSGVMPVENMDNLQFQYYIRVTAKDCPGVLSKISGILGDNGVSIASCFQKGHGRDLQVPILMVTHFAKEGSLKAALKEIDALDIIKAESIYLRIESEKKEEIS
ncbi:MAG: homoserine dehydrogenase [Elusimicrobia bacterium]|jgi:homoserine dehydrogenase|nr:homoserine dehydrogenase [Elusimicrobiota bacterium]